jgi:hypothetical protein
VQEKLGPHAASNVATEIRTEWKQYMDTYTKGVFIYYNIVLVAFCWYQSIY